jgi:hypothetical protein
MTPPEFVVSLRGAVQRIEGEGRKHQSGNSLQTARKARPTLAVTILFAAASNTGSGTT